MNTTTTDRQVEQADRCAGILEDRHENAECTNRNHGAFLAAGVLCTCSPDYAPATPVHPTIEARALADAVVDLFQTDTLRLWDMVSDSLFANPIRLDWIARDNNLPRPTDAVKATCIGLVRSKGLAATLSPIPAADQRPVCVTVAWLTAHPGHAARLEYFDGDNGWQPAAEAIRGIDPEWPVEIRETKQTSV